MHRNGVTFDLGSATMSSTATFETYFSYHKAIGIAATDYKIYFYLIMLYPIID